MLQLGDYLREGRLELSISSRFSVAVHTLALLEEFKEQRLTSEFIAGSVGTNPVVIRRILSMLKANKLIDVQAGAAGGAKLTKALKDISLLDIYKAVSVIKGDNLFSIHEKPHPDCAVGGHIQGVLVQSLGSVQQQMEAALDATYMSDIMNNIHIQQKLKRQ